jgi:alanyl-tRNA synthetase
LPPADSDVGSDPDNWMEIWNNVFMEYYRDDTGTLTKLPAQNVDTWMGFERMCLVLQDKTSPYDTDVFQPAIHILEKSLDISYDNHARRMRIITDHCRTALSLIAENLQPSNEWRWYVLRMLIRRMYYNIVLLKNTVDTESLFEQLVSFFWFTQLHKWVLVKEIQQFQKTLSNGQKEFEKIISSLNGKQVAWSDVFKLYDTFGFPYELTAELAQEKWLTIDEAWFRAALEEQKNRSRQATKGKFTLDIDRSAHIQGMPATQFVWYDNLVMGKNNDVISTEAKRSGEISNMWDLSTGSRWQNINPKLLKDFDVNGQRVFIFDKTPFYAEGGGQTGDRGIITLDSWEVLNIIDVKKYEGVFLHFVG